MRSVRSLFKLVPLIMIAAILLQGCGPVQPLLLGKRTPHQEYTEGLKTSGLDSTALGLAWTKASENAFQQSVPVSTPFQETAYFSVEEPSALGYRIKARRGERITIRAEVVAARPVRLFLDVYEIRSNGEREHVISADQDPQIEFVAPKDREYVVRMQPELLQSATATIIITTGASMAQPVKGYDSKAIRSFFGDARDGGKRRHEGVDVFAPKGTPVVAVAEGIARSGNSNLGGKVVWLYDQENNLNIYYAHLDSQYVGMLQKVQIGDTLGTVGNTGNAKHTPPHLHFGIYARGEGAVDPLPFLNMPKQDPAPITADLDLLREPARIKVKTSTLRIAPDAKAETLATMPQHSFIQIRSVTEDYYRIHSGAIAGYVRAKDVIAAEGAIKKIELRTDQRLLDAPDPLAAPLRELAKGGTVELLAENGDLKFVRTEDEMIGWITVE